MPKEVPKCELEKIEVTEEYFLNLQAFLEDLELSWLEAQIILEVYKYPEYYIGLKTLEKKLSSKISNLKGTVKNLVESGFLKYYESKKPSICVLCNDMGRLVAEEILERCYSEKLQYYPSMFKRFKYLKERRCIDPENFKEGERRIIHLNHFQLSIEIEKIFTSDAVDTSEDGTPIFGRRLIGRISKCPRCDGEIPIDFSYDHKNIYTEDVNVKCQNCGFEFFLGRCLKWAYIV